MLLSRFSSSSLRSSRRRCATSWIFTAGRDIARNSVASDVPVSSMTAPTSRITIRMRAPTTPTAEASGAPSIPPTSPAPPDSTPRV